MKRLPIFVIVTICTVPLYAWAQQPDMAKLKADAQKIVSIIKSDKVKTQAYCEIGGLAPQIERAAQEKKREEN